MHILLLLKALHDLYDYKNYIFYTHAKCSFFPV